MMKNSLRVASIKGEVIIFDDTIQAEPPLIVEAGLEGLSDFSKSLPTAADSCIYCGSVSNRTREHVVPYALGGTVTIPKGSCSSCQNITQGFERSVLRGPMKMARYIQGLPSRKGYANTAKTIAWKVTIDGRNQSIDVPIEESPVLLAFPLFEEPTFLSDVESGLKVKGIATVNFGIEPRAFADRVGATQIQFTSGDHSPVAFAQMIAKIAYTNAYINGQICRLKDPKPLVDAMLYKPDGIGGFVGTASGPYVRRCGVSHYIGLHEVQDRPVLFSTVQLFAASGAPTYLVVLGELR